MGYNRPLEVRSFFSPLFDVARTMLGTHEAFTRNAFRCCICDTEITRQQARSFQTCTSWKCRCEYRGRLRDQAKQAEAKYEQALIEFRSGLCSTRNQLADACGFEHPERFLPVCVPSYKAEMVQMKADRREKLRAFLLALVEDCTRETDVDPHPHSETPDLARGTDSSDHDAASETQTMFLRVACTCCGGHCCTDGGDQAYFTVDTMRRYIARHPDQSPDAIVDDYLQHVPDETYEASCIYHSATGCSLPRQMRADLCNAFECYGLTHLRDLVAENAATGLFIAATNQGQVMRYRFVEPLHQPDAPPSGS
ncbi:hypothetical protein NZK35_32480 [Stieleria sp. ICT_E10.1]|uniref:hypothetical protein n=1 Tax=Stieleria sedimenti TaxID=2976331 RepID=UPI00217F3AF4|nr:hypothetical protein [Stieleria sedimenti]MCS7471388.1 hypothetical protein [Stieleria sedimenti]